MRKFFLVSIALVFFGLLNNLSYSQMPNWMWAKSAGGTDDDYGFSIAVDASGNTYVTGEFDSPTITFGSDTLTNAGYGSIFLVKYDANGNVLWAKSAGGTYYDYGHSVAVDASGNVYLTGYFNSPTITFGLYTLTNSGTNNSTDIFLAKYDTGGNVLWAKSAGGTENDYGRSVAVDSSGNAYVTGWFESPTITFGSDTLINPYGGNIFLVKYDSGGDVLWAKNTTSTGYDPASAVAVDAPGNAYVTGSFYGSTAIFGSDTLTSAGFGDIYLVKYDAGGNVMWAKSAGGTAEDEGISVGVDASGNAYVTGLFYSTTMIFGPDTLINPNGENIFLLKYDAGGNELWATCPMGRGLGYSVAVDASGKVYLTGNFINSAITFGSYILPNAGLDDIFLTIYDANGNVLWATSAGGTGYDYGHAVAVDASGNAYVAGYFHSPSITFGYDTLTNTANNGTSYDIFLSKLGHGNVGFDELNHSLSILVYPNPASDKITVDLPVEKAGSIISIVDIKGQQILYREITKPVTTIDISPLQRGVYLVKLVGEKGIQAGKFIKE